MNKKILVVLMRDFSIGGSLTSLLNLLNYLRAAGVTVDLLVQRHSGTLFQKENIAANLLPEDPVLSALAVPIKELVANRDFKRMLYRAAFFVLHHLVGAKKARDLLYRKAARRYSDYDVVVAFQEGISTDLAQYISAPKKIAWVHNEAKWIISNNSCEEFCNIYSKFNKIICVSHTVKNSLRNYIPDINKRGLVIYNTMNVDRIRKLAKESVDNTSSNCCSLKDFIFVTVGRFMFQKRMTIIPDVALILKNKGYKFRWIVVGDGKDYFEVVNKCKDLSVDDCIELVGSQCNPYKYINCADCIVITSEYEAHPMVANEALILHKPVITTNYPSACEVVDNQINGFICEKDVNSIAAAMEVVMKEKETFNTLMENVNRFEYSNDAIIKQVLELLKGA